MSNYTKATNFATKDGLTTGDPAKRIKGTEIDTEYNAIASAISSKADSNSPTLTGTPLAPTASSGTNTTQIATTALVFAAMQALYPVGSIYSNVSSSTNPGTLFGFGTWTAATWVIVSTALIQVVGNDGIVSCPITCSMARSYQGPGTDLIVYRLKSQPRDEAEIFCYWCPMKNLVYFMD